ncbi:MAG TPA: NAD-dependent epimerase/dehydratase family protein [Bacilli bacterium]|nr:NAD-dependent epimerase/dehydratase family protein [Bacilli bacterium]
MSKYLLIGGGGFIGINFAAYLKGKGHQVFVFHHNDDLTKLPLLIDKSDFIFLLAGVNRPEQGNFSDNKTFAESVVKALKQTSMRIPLLFASSLQADDIHSEYGKSKKEAEDVLKSFFEMSGYPIYILRLPNIFGKWAKINHHSVVATFSDCIIREIKPPFINKQEVKTYLYIDDLIDLFMEYSENKHRDELGKTSSIEKGVPLTADELFSRLENIYKMYKLNTLIGDYSNHFDVSLLATLLSYIPFAMWEHSIQTHSDNRGSFMELVKAPIGGQFALNVVNPYQTKGNHYHMSKWERFIILKGKGRIEVKNVINNAFFSFNLDESKKQMIDIMPGFSHRLINDSSSPLMVLIYASRLYDESNLDTYIDNE